MSNTIEFLAHDDPRVPDRSSCTVSALLGTRADLHPDRLFALFESGERWTYAHALERARSTAAGLARAGVTRHDHVLSWLPNGPDPLRVWFGANLLGAAYVPINTSYKGGILEHAIRVSQAKVLVAHAQLVPRLASVSLGDVHTVVVVGGPVTDSVRARLDVLLLEADSLEADPAEAPSPDTAEPWDTQTVIYTSGTTGPSKGVLLSYVHHYSAALAAFGTDYGQDERYLIQLPLFHVGGTLGVYGALLHGSSIAVVEAFRTDRFWSIVRDMGVTGCTILGVMASFLLKQPERTDDADNPLRWAWLVPLTGDAEIFGKRFGIDVHSMYNMTEVPCPITSPANPSPQGTCGRVRGGVQARVVDEHDRDVPVGAVGELILRTDRPWALNSGYLGMPAETAKAWRNGWFHTGDAVQTDEEGNFFFVDRMKDTIRRRGENISSFEVEVEITAHPDVREAAVCAVPGQHGEDEVMAVVSSAPGRTVDPAELLEFLIPRMAHFMVPRYVSVLETLPRTPTNKVEKYLLRERGLTPDTWDRESVGMRVARERLN